MDMVEDLQLVSAAPDWRRAGVVVWARASHERPTKDDFRVQCLAFRAYFADGVGGNIEEYAACIRPDATVRWATDALWADYCIRHDLPLATPYEVRLTGPDWERVELDINQTPRQAGLLDPSWYDREFDAVVYLAFYSTAATATEASTEEESRG